MTIHDQKTETDLQLSQGYSAGNNTSAYETENYDRIAKTSRFNDPAYRAAFILGFFSSFEPHEMGEHSEAYLEALHSEHGKRCVELGYCDAPEAGELAQ